MLPVAFNRSGWIKKENEIRIAEIFAATACVQHNSSETNSCLQLDAILLYQMTS